MTRRNSLCEKVRLGEREVSRLGFGALRLPGEGAWGEPVDAERARAVLRRAVALGIELIDTAWFYGPHVANRLIAEALWPYPPGLVLTTKLGVRRTPDGGWAPFARPTELREAAEHDLRDLKRDVLDVVHLRFMARSGVPFLESLDALIALREEGKIRHVALSGVGLPQLGQGLARTEIVAVQNHFTLAGGGGAFAERTHAGVEDPEGVLALCQARGIAFLAYAPLAGGTLGRPGPALRACARRHGATLTQIALAWLLARSPVIVPIPGTASIGHLEENVAARGLRLSVAEVQAIAEEAKA